MQKISRPLSSSLRNLSYNRKKQELDKIFSSSNAKYGIDLLIELGLDEVLEIYNLKDVKLNCDLLGIWATLSVSPKYEFTSNEKGIIKDIRHVLKNGVNNYSLYQYGLYVNQVAADILGMDRSLVAKKYDMLPITSRKSIDITSNDIMTLLNRKAGPYFKDIYNDLVVKILDGKLNNNNEEIKSYLLENYS